jgi:hypothetical protein
MQIRDGHTRLGGDGQVGGLEIHQPVQSTQIDGDSRFGWRVAQLGLRTATRWINGGSGSTGPGQHCGQSLAVHGTHRCDGQQPADCIVAELAGLCQGVDADQIGELRGGGAGGRGRHW